MGGGNGKTGLRYEPAIKSAIEKVKRVPRLWALITSQLELSENHYETISEIRQRSLDWWRMFRQVELTHAVS